MCLYTHNLQPAVSDTPLQALLHLFILSYSYPHALVPSSFPAVSGRVCLPFETLSTLNTLHCPVGCESGSGGGSGSFAGCNCRRGGGGGGGSGGDGGGGGRRHFERCESESMEIDKDDCGVGESQPEWVETEESRPHRGGEGDPRLSSPSPPHAHVSTSFPCERRQQCRW